MNQLIDIVQQVVQKEQGRQAPADLVYGVVTSTAPLTITVESRFSIGAEHLIVSALCKPMVVSLGHKHTLEGQDTDEQLTSVVLWRGLQPGDRVRLLRSAGGQTFYVLDREVFP